MTRLTTLDSGIASQLSSRREVTDILLKQTPVNIANACDYKQSTLLRADTLTYKIIPIRGHPREKSRCLLTGELY